MRGYVQFNKHTHTHTHRADLLLWHWKISLTKPGCVVMYNLINTTHARAHPHRERASSFDYDTDNVDPYDYKSRSLYASSRHQAVAGQ